MKLSVIELYWDVKPCHLAELTNILEKAYHPHLNDKKRGKKFYRSTRRRIPEDSTVQSSPIALAHTVQYICSASSAYTDQILPDMPPIVVLQLAMQPLNNVRFTRMSFHCKNLT